MGRRPVASRRLVLGAIVLGLFLVFDAGLFAWLLLRSLSEREISRVLLETRAEAEEWAERLAGEAENQGEDLYMAMARQREVRTYIDSVLTQKEIVRTVVITDREGRLVFQRETKDRFPLAPSSEQLQLKEREAPPSYTEKETERQETFDVYDLTVPIRDLGEIHIGISRDEMGRRVAALQRDLLRQAGVVGGASLLLLLSAYIVIWRLIQRGERLKAQAAEAERMAYVGTLAAGLAHEIRNPLNSLSLNVQMIEEELAGGARDGTTGRILSITRKELGRLERLATDFLAYARPRSPEKERVPAGELLRHVRELMAPQLAGKGIELALDDRSAGACVHVDRQQITQLLLNLTHNAVHAVEETGRPPRIALRTHLLGARVLLEVEDNGVGILPSDRERVFDVFFSTRKGGTGLGLAIAKRIAEAHGGELELDSAPGEGTRARLWLPAEAGEAEAAGSHELHPAPRPQPSA